MKTLGCLLLLVLCDVAFGQECSIPGECKGTSLETEFVASERLCLDRCKQTEGCEWYSFDAGKGYCSILKNCPQIDTSCTSCVSGENECEIPLICNKPGECAGNLIDHIDATSAEECLERCHDDYPNCQFFSFHTTFRVCSLYLTCSLDESEANVISGERDCYQEGAQTNTKVFLHDRTETAWMHMPSINENGNGTTCNQPADYPIEAAFASAQVIDGSITVCGGILPPSYKECFSLETTLNIWVEFPSMDGVRAYAGSLMTPAGWWLAGGWNSDLMSSTTLWDGSAWKPGPDLPSAREQPCLTQVNSSHSFLAGGFGEGGQLNDAYLFDWTREVWTELPNTLAEQDALACTTYIDERGREHILTAGGSPDRRLVQSLALTSPSAWLALPDLPSDVYWGTFIRDGDQLVIVNPAEGNLLQFEESSQTFKVIPGQTVPIMEDWVISLAIGDDHLNGCT